MNHTEVKAAIDAGLALLPAKMDTPAARAQMYAIGLQESRFQYRVQLGGGPAHSWWQMERGGGVRGVLRHTASAALARAVCAARGVDAEEYAVHKAMITDDVLGAAFARLLLWTDARALPGLDADDDTTWDYYFDNWRPGKPHRETWGKFRAQAVELVRGEL